MEKFIKIFKALSNDTRLTIFLLLLKEELCVCELVRILNLEQSRISHALKTLKEASLVNSKREKNWIIYFASNSILTNKIIKGIETEISLPKKILENLINCKSENIRINCKTN